MGRWRFAQAPPLSVRLSQPVSTLTRSALLYSLSHSDTKKTETKVGIAIIKFIPRSTIEDKYGEWQLDTSAKRDQTQNQIKAGEFTGPFNQLPWLELDDGTTISQTRAILRLIAREGGFDGDTNVEAAKADEITDAVEDIKDDFFKTIFEKDDEKRMTHADLDMFSLLDMLESSSKERDLLGMLGAVPLVKAHKERVATNTKIAEYLQTRKDTPL
uniref:glutathione transferase n=1 Tax=Branchiostoma floridae TaxID=7739 RepID=C3Y6I2_BRAFL|eukprot:XP_002607932.1 hypothetical protein BRAFLDRAFT_74882 [Branchiostoma floridae]